MKCTKMLALLAMSAASTMAFAGSASADQITNGAGEIVTSTQATAIGHAVIDAPFGTVECGSTISGTVTSQGVGKDIDGNITTLDFTKCTGGKTVVVLNDGTYTLDVTKTNSGTMTSSGFIFTVTDHTFGINCVYGTSNTHIGTLTGGTAAKLHIDSAAIPRIEHSFFCGSSSEWTGSYTFTTPHTLHLFAS